jgi:hypothetical protein
MFFGNHAFLTRSLVEEEDGINDWVKQQVIEQGKAMLSNLGLSLVSFAADRFAPGLGGLFGGGGDQVGAYIQELKDYMDGEFDITNGIVLDFWSYVAAKDDQELYILYEDAVARLVELNQTNLRYRITSDCDDIKAIDDDLSELRETLYTAINPYERTTKLQFAALVVSLSMKVAEEKARCFELQALTDTGEIELPDDTGDILWWFDNFSSSERAEIQSRVENQILQWQRTRLEDFVDFVNAMANGSLPRGGQEITQRSLSDFHMIRNFSFYPTYHDDKDWPSLLMQGGSAFGGFFASWGLNYKYFTLGGMTTTDIGWYYYYKNDHSFVKFWGNLEPTIPPEDEFCEEGDANETCGKFAIVETGDHREENGWLPSNYTSLDIENPSDYLTGFEYLTPMEPWLVHRNAALDEYLINQYAPVQELMDTWWQKLQTNHKRTWNSLDDGLFVAIYRTKAVFLDNSSDAAEYHLASGDTGEFQYECGRSLFPFDELEEAIDRARYEEKLVVGYGEYTISEPIDEPIRILSRGSQPMLIVGEEF